MSLLGTTRQAIVGCCLLAACSAGASPPAIELDLTGAVELRDHSSAEEECAVQNCSAPLVDTGDGTFCHEGLGLCVAERKGRECPVTVSNDTTCPPPDATAYDHHDEGAIEVTRTEVMFIESAPQSAPEQVFREIEAIDYGMRGENIVYYDAVDRAGNQAEQLPFSITLVDHVKPTLDPAIQDTTVQSCDHQSDAPNRRLWHLPNGTLAHDTYDGDVSSRVTVSVIPPEDGIGCDGEETRSFDGEDGIEIDTHCLGNYTIRYEVEDYAEIFGVNQENNHAEIEIRLTVKDTCAPALVCHSDFFWSLGDLGTTGFISSSVEPKQVDEEEDRANCAARCFDQVWNSDMDCDSHEEPCVYFQYNADTSVCSLHTEAAGELFDEENELGHLQGNLFGCQNDTIAECNVTYVDPGAVCVDMRDSTPPDGVIDQYALNVTVNEQQNLHPNSDGTFTLSFQHMSLTTALPKEGQHFVGPMRGLYDVSYQCTDVSGNPSADVLRRVRVVDSTPPELTLLGNLNVQLLHRNGLNSPEVDEMMNTDQVATCRDICEGDLFQEIEASLFKGNCNGTWDCVNEKNGKTKVCTGVGTGADPEDLDHDEFGTWAIMYSCADASGNSVSKCRTIEIAEIHTPVPTPVPTPCPPVDCDQDDWEHVNGTVEEGYDDGHHFVNGTWQTVEASENCKCVGKVYDCQHTAEEGRLELEECLEKPWLMRQTDDENVELGVTVPCGSGERELNAKINAYPTCMGEACLPNQFEECDCFHQCKAQPCLAYRVPVLNVLDGDLLTLEASTTEVYVDAMASCQDSVDGDINHKVNASGTFVNMGEPGVYTIHYTCENDCGMQAIPTNRTVVVVDGHCPQCEVGISGVLGRIVLEASFPYDDTTPVHCTDDMLGELNYSRIGELNVERTGTYHITYRARDASKNFNDGLCKGSNSHVRTVVVVDTLQPVVSLAYAGELVQKSGPGSNSTTDAGYPNPAITYGALMAEGGGARAGGAAWLVGAGAAGLVAVAYAAAAAKSSRAGGVKKKTEVPV
jgi:hypothetical protein